MWIVTGKNFNHMLWTFIHHYRRSVWQSNVNKVKVWTGLATTCKNQYWCIIWVLLCIWPSNRSSVKINQFFSLTDFKYNLFVSGQKKNMCVYCHMLKKIMVGRAEMIFFFNFIFMPPAWKVRWGHLVIGSSVRPSVRLSVRLSVIPSRLQSKCNI